MDVFAKIGRLSQLERLVGVLLSLPASNAVVERVFSLSNGQWTDERNKLLPATVRSLLLVQMNLEMSCSEFYSVIRQDNALLRKVRSSLKY